MRHTYFRLPAVLGEFVIITGWVLSVVCNISFGAWLLYLLLKKVKIALPQWLPAVNLTCLLVQIIYFIFIRP